MNNIKPVSFHLQWSITERCNLNCEHCYRDPKLVEQELEPEDLLKILDRFIDQIERWELAKRDVRISFTGGEPLVKEGFFDLLEKCEKNKNRFAYGVLSNGLLIDESTALKLRELGINYVQISLEGSKETNDEIRGEGVFKKATEAIKVLKKTGIDTMLSMTVSKVNLEDVPEMVKLSKEMNTPLGVRRLVPIGEREGLSDLLLTPTELRKLWHYVMEVDKNSEARISIGCEDGMLTQDFPNYRPGDCSAGYASFTVLPNGDVYPCRRLPLKAGNLLEESFEEIYQSDIFKKLRNVNNLNDVCYQCPFFEKCKGGAKCLSAAYFDDFSTPDPQCWRLFDELPDPDLKWKNSQKERSRKLDSKWISSGS